MTDNELEHQRLKLMSVTIIGLAAMFVLFVIGFAIIYHLDKWIAAGYLECSNIASHAKL